MCLSAASHRLGAGVSTGAGVGVEEDHVEPGGVQIDPQAGIGSRINTRVEERDGHGARVCGGF